MVTLKGAAVKQIDDNLLGTGPHLPYLYVLENQPHTHGAVLVMTLKGAALKQIDYSLLGTGQHLPYLYVLENQPHE